MKVTETLPFVNSPFSSLAGECFSFSLERHARTCYVPYYLARTLRYQLTGV
jgi:hypothetical protein